MNNNFYDNIEILSGDTCYYKNGSLVLIKYHDGSKYWYKNGRLHREDGPAIESANGYKAWFKEGYAHREDGPALENIDGTVKYYRVINNYLLEFRETQTFIYNKGNYNKENKIITIIETRLPLNISEEKLKLLLTFI